MKLYFIKDATPEDGATSMAVTLDKGAIVRDVIASIEILGWKHVLLAEYKKWRNQKEVN